MGLSRNRAVFGIHSITPYRRADQIPYGILQVIGGANLELTGESEDLYGGSSRFAYASEPTQISTQLTANVKSYPNFLMELFLGGTLTSQVSAAAGEIRNTTDLKGTSVIAATGILAPTLTASDKADLKFGRYVIEAKDATHINVYAMTNIDFNRGVDTNYLDDSLMILSDQAIATSTAVVMADWGITITGGAGTIGMTAGDTAIFDVFPPHGGISEIEVGSATSEFPEFGAFFLASKTSSRDIFQIQAYRCVGAGMPIPLQEKAFMISDLTMKLLRDETSNSVFKITHIEEVS